MELREIIDMAVYGYLCRVWDNNKEEYIFYGTTSNIPEHLKKRKITSWEINDNIIGFNID